MGCKVDRGNKIGKKSRQGEKGREKQIEKIDRKNRQKKQMEKIDRKKKYRWGVKQIGEIRQERKVDRAKKDKEKYIEK